MGLARSGMQAYTRGFRPIQPNIASRRYEYPRAQRCSSVKTRKSDVVKEWTERREQRRIARAEAVPSQTESDAIAGPVVRQDRAGQDDEVMRTTWHSEGRAGQDASRKGRDEKTKQDAVRIVHKLSRNTRVQALRPTPSPARRDGPRLRKATRAYSRSWQRARCGSRLGLGPDATCLGAGA